MSPDALNPADATLLALKRLAPGGRPIRVTSPSFSPNTAIPEIHAQAGENTSPSLTFDGVPPSARSIVVLVEDPDAPPPYPKPFVHWVVVNLPPRTPFLRAAIPDDAVLADLGHARQGVNSAKTVGYTGMAPPKADPAHHYHFQVFALDTVLTLADGETPDLGAVVEQMKGHVLAAGVLVGRFAASTT